MPGTRPKPAMVNAVWGPGLSRQVQRGQFIQVEFQVGRRGHRIIIERGGQAAQRELLQRVTIRSRRRGRGFCRVSSGLGRPGRRLLHRAWAAGAVSRWRPSSNTVRPRATDPGAARAVEAQALDGQGGEVRPAAIDGPAL